MSKIRVKTADDDFGEKHLVSYVFSEGSFMDLVHLWLWEQVLYLRITLGVEGAARGRGQKKPGKLTPQSLRPLYIKKPSVGGWERHLG